MAIKREKQKGIDIKFFVFPFVMLFFLFASITYTSIKNHIKSTYAMIETSSITIAQSYNRRLTNSQKADQIIRGLLRDKFLALGDAVEKLTDYRSSVSLAEIRDLFKVDEINLFAKTGQVIGSTRAEKMGQRAGKGHPVYEITPAPLEAFFADAANTDENTSYRYAHLRLDDDVLLEIGISTTSYNNFFEQFTIEQLINDLMATENITNIFFTNKNYELVASGVAEFVGVTFSKEEIHTHFLHDKPQVGSEIVGGSKTLHVCAPVFFQNEKIGTLTVVWPPEIINREIKRILLDNSMRFALVALVLACVLYYAYRKNKVSIELAYYDKLTGLPNAEYLKEYLTRKSKLLPRQKLAILLLNCENFQLINLTHGYWYGDSILQQMAAGLAGLVQAGQMLFRLSADRFIMVVTDYKDITALEELAQAAGRVFKQPHYAMHRHEYLILKTAIYELRDKSLTIDQIIHHAALGLNTIKGNNSHDSVVFNEQMQQIPERNKMIENAIIGIIHSKSTDFFTMAYQPVFCLRTGKLSGFEALARLKVTGMGEVSPLEFIPLSEERNLIFSLGLIIFQEVCLFLQLLAQAGCPDLKVSVNLSGLQLLRADFIQAMQDIVADSAVSWQQLVFELTESVLVDNYSLINKKLARLKRLGSIIALDDFGTGYSSYAELRNLGIDIIKIDRTFIKEIDAFSESDLIIDNIIALAHKLGLFVVAEGVETKKQLDYLIKHNCDASQGFYFSRPLSEQEAMALLAKKGSCSPT